MPDWRKEVRAALAHLSLEPGQEESIVEELAQHLSEKYGELLDSGVREEDAYSLVLEDLNKHSLSAELRPVFGSERSPVIPEGDERSGLLTGFGKDVRLGMRQLRQSPGLAVVALLSLALGIGANTAIFELLDAVVLRMLPVSAPQELADVRVVHEGRIGNTVARQQEMSAAIWEQLRQRQQAFSSIAAWSTEGFNLGHGGEARYADGLWVSGSFFETLRVQPVLGRLFSTSDDRKGCGSEGVVISHSFWQGEFGGRKNVLGDLVSLDGHTFQIVGVTPQTFSGLEVGRKFDVALPLCSEPFIHGDDSWTSSPITWWLAVIGRLKPGWTFQRATAQLMSISSGVFASTLPPEYDPIARKSYLRFSLHAVPAATGVSPLRNDYEFPLLLLLAISGIVLLIACANIANLMLARASARQHEMALRLAIGASRIRLVRQLLVESLLLAMAGAAVGALLAHVLSTALIAAISTDQDRVFLFLSPDWRVLGFTAALAILTCVIFGVAPALQAANTDPGAVIKAGGRGLTTGRERLLLRRGFIVSQVALSLVLVVAALLFVQTFQNLVRLDVGFRQDHILVANLDFSPLKLPVQNRLEYRRQLLEQVRAIPGIILAAQTFIVPLSGDSWQEFLNFPGGARRKLVNFNSISSGYFRTLGIPLLAGRDFNVSDTVNSPPVAVVNQAFAKAFLGDVNPIGKTFGERQDGGKPDKVYRIVGVVENTKYRSLKEPYGPIAFVAQNQDPNPDLDSTMLIRSNEQLTSLISSLNAVAARNNPEIVLNFSVLRTSILERLGSQRLMAALSGFYGLLAAILSMVGLYGVMSYTVVRRTSEIGIRMALGASRARILGMIVRDALIMLGIGLSVGTILVIATGRAVQSMLFGLKPTDPLSLGTAVTGLAIVALAASLLPARRAASLQPIQTLREE